MKSAGRRARALIAMETADVRLLRIFMTVVEAGGLTAAQADLHLSLPSISEKLSALEQRLGVKLCKRGRSGFSLTENGRAIYEEGQRLLGSLVHFSRRVAELRSHLGGRISIGVVDNAISDSRMRLADAVAEFVRVAPTVHISLEIGSPEILLREVVAQKLNLAIGSFPRVALGLSYTDLYDEMQHFCCGRDHPLFNIEDRLIDIEAVRVHRIIARGYWAARDIKIFAIPSSHATVSNMEAEAYLIKSGAFLGYLPDHYARSFVEQGQVRILRPDLFSYKARFQIAAPDEWKKLPVSRAFIEILTRLSA